MKAPAIFAVALTRLLSGLALTLTLTLDSACTHRRLTTDIEKESMEMRPYQEPNYGPALPLVPRDALLKALKKAGKERKTVKLPITIKLRSNGMRGWEEAYMGEGEGKIVLKLHDGALGVSLEDRIHQYCPQGEWCKLWVTGHWGEKGLVLEDKKTDPNTFDFGLRAVLAPQTNPSEAMVYIEQK